MPRSVLESIRALLLVVLLLGLVGTASELLLLAHYEDRWQIVPLALIAAALAALAWHGIAAGRSSVRTIQALMVGFLAAGVLGVVLHYRGNLEFQREIDASMSGATLFWKVMQAKAPPALAPGEMVQLGLIGLAWTYGHPAARDVVRSDSVD